MKRCVVAVIATYGRPREVERLFNSLSGVDYVVVCDNSAMPEIRCIADRAPVRTEYLPAPQNLGCGGGLHAAEERAWEIAGESMTHLLVLDDDAVLRTDTVELLAQALMREDAVAAYPIVLGSDGLVGWTPGLRDRRLHHLSENRLGLADYRQQFGQSVADFEWAQGICLLARRDAVERAGYHRADFWVRGEDLDFSLRLTATGRGVFVTDAVAEHHPPPSVAGKLESEYLRHAAMIQNIAFLAFTQPHGTRVRDSLLGAMRRFIAIWGARAIVDAAKAVWRGAAKSESAGMGKGATFKHRFDELA